MITQKSLFMRHHRKLVVSSLLLMFFASPTRTHADNQPPCSECKVTVTPSGVASDIDYHVTPTHVGLKGWRMQLSWYAVGAPAGAYYKYCDNNNNYGLQSFNGRYVVNNPIQVFYLNSGHTRPYLGPAFETHYTDPCTLAARRNGTTSRLVWVTAGMQRTGNSGPSGAGSGVNGGGLGGSGGLGGGGAGGGGGGGDSAGGTPPRPNDDDNFEPESCDDYENEDTREPSPLPPALGVEFVTENIHFTHRKNGFIQYNYNADEHPTPKYFLEEHATTSISGDGPESPVGGSITQRICQMTSQIVVTAKTENPSWYGANSSANMTVTETTASGSQEVTDYDDPPNEEEDTPAQMSFESTLSDEYTKERMMQDTFFHAWRFRGGDYFTSQFPVAGLIIDESEESVFYLKTTYKIRIPIDEVAYPRPYRVTWIEEFTPEDTEPNDSVTPENEYKFYSEEIPTGKSETQLKLIDPRDPEKEGTWNVRLLPIEVVLRKKTESTAPETGLLVKKGDVVTFDINGSASASTFPLPPESVKWKTRQLKHDGTTTTWIDVVGQGAELDFTTNESGVFEAKAIVTPQGGQASEFPLTRKKDAPHADNREGQVQDFHKAGAVDYFGVADQQWQINVRNKALENLGSEYYKKEGECVVQGSTVAPNPSNKCNIFIYHKCWDAGAPVPLTRGGLPSLRTGPPLAIDWWNDNSGRTDDAGRTIASFHIPNWSRLPDGTMPQPGLIVAHPNLAGEPDQYDSHVGIFDYDGSWISAGFAKVNKYYHPNTSGYHPQGYRKYTGGN